VAIRENEFADKFNPCQYVVSSPSRTAEWNNSTWLSGDVVEEVSKLKQEQTETSVVTERPAPQALIEHDLVDELATDGVPGRPWQRQNGLFGDTSNKKRLRLTDSKTVGDGVAILIYERVRDPNWRQGSLTGSLKSIMTAGKSG